nr:hypothetical protein [Bryobacter sp.]
MFQRLRLPLVAATFSFALQALDPSLSVSQYHKQYWQVEQGLPHSYVPSIRVGPDGYLLVATAEGLARFDGISFRPFQADPALRLPQRWISALLTARDGSLWVGTFEDGTIIQLKEGRVAGKYDAGGSVFDLVEDSEGAVWAATRNGLLRCRSGTAARQQGLRPPAETSWNVLSIDRSGTLWVVTADGLYERRGESFLRRLANNRIDGDIFSVTASRAGGLWLGTSTGLFRMTGAATRVQGVPGPVVSVLEDRDGTLWAGCWGKGLYRVQSGQVAHWSSADGLPDDSIRTLAEDHEGNLWIGMRSGGLGRWRDTRIVPLGTAEG